VYDERGYTESVYDHYEEPSGTITSHAPIPAEIKEPHQDRPPLQIWPSNSKIFSVMASLEDRDAQEHGIYKSRMRANINCPNLGTPAMGKSSKSKAMGYMDCIKRRYFGHAPLPPEIFANPADSKRMEIKMATMDDFLNESKML